MNYSGNGPSPSGRIGHGRHHKRPRHSNDLSAFRRVELFLMKYFLGILGSALIVAGIVYLLSSSMIYSEIRSFFSALLSGGSGGAEETFNGTYPFSFILFLPLIAGLILVVFGYFYYDRLGIWSGIAGIAGLVILLFFHSKVILSGAHAGVCYPNVWTGAILTVIIFLTVMLTEYRFNTKWMQLPGIIWFFLVIFLLHRVFLWWSSETIFISLAMIALLAPANYLLSFKNKSPLNNVFYALLGLLYLVMFWSRKFYMQQELSLMTGYILISTFMFLVFMVQGITGAFDSERRFGKIAGIILVVLNHLVYTITVWYILNTTGLKQWQWIQMLLIPVVTMGSIYFLDRLKLARVRVPFIILSTLQLSLVLPFMLRISQPVLFASALSVLLMIYARTLKNPILTFSSLVILLLAVAGYLYLWADIYFPKLFLTGEGIDFYYFRHGSISGLFLIPAVWLVRYYLKSSDVKLRREWLSVKKSKRALDVVFIALVYLFFYWILDYSICRLSQFTNIDLYLWFIYHLAFCLALFILYDRKKNWLQVLLIISMISLFLLPLVNQATVEFRNRIYEASTSLTFFTILMVISGTLYYLFLYRIYQLSQKVFSNKKRIISLIYIILSAGLIYCTIVLFDHFSVVASAGSGKSIKDILDYNLYIPYSMIFLIGSMVLIVSGLVLHVRAIRQTGIFLLIASILKVFIMDFHFLNETMRIMIFFILGGILILASLWYRQFRKYAGKRGSHKGSKSYEEAELSTEEKKD